MIAQAPPPKVVWSPLPGSQAAAVSCPCNVILYEGSRGPGKTDAQLMAFRKHVGKGYGRAWRGVIFDKQYKNLDDLISKSERWFNQFGDGARFLRAKSDYKWVWPSGEELLFRQFEKDADYWKFHGQEFPFIGWNELAKFPTPKGFDLMFSCNRSGFLPAEHSPDLSNPLPPLPLVCFATTNPYGPGHNWVKLRFIDVAQAGEVVKTEIDTFNPQTQKRETITRTQVRLFGSYRENRYLDPLYVATLEAIKEPNRRRAWLMGDWNIVAGGALDDLWQESTHVIPRFIVPREWTIYRSLDWGSSKPFSVGWHAIANGERVKLANGKWFCPPRGSVIRFAEWYGTQELGSNEGLRIGSREVAQGILDREHNLLTDGWIKKTPLGGPADSSIFDTADTEADTIGQRMEEMGVYWEHANKSPGSRKRGLQVVRDRLKASLTGEEPGVYFTENCRAALALLPTLPRDEKDPDDVDTEAEDHLYDELRYMLTGSLFPNAGRIKAEFPT